MELILCLLFVCLLFGLWLKLYEWVEKRGEKKRDRHKSRSACVFCGKGYMTEGMSVVFGKNQPHGNYCSAMYHKECLADLYENIDKYDDYSLEYALCMASASGDWVKVEAITNEKQLRTVVIMDGSEDTQGQVKVLTSNVMAKPFNL